MHRRSAPRAWAGPLLLLLLSLGVFFFVLCGRLEERTRSLERSLVSLKRKRPRGGEQRERERKRQEGRGRRSNASSALPNKRVIMLAFRPCSVRFIRKRARGKPQGRTHLTSRAAGVRKSKRSVRERAPTILECGRDERERQRDGALQGFSLLRVSFLQALYL